MKQYKGIFWRSNPQLANGGYETTRTVEAKTLSSATKKLNKICDSCIYGGMSLKAVELVSE
jgi:hypothetical protein